MGKADDRHSAGRRVGKEGLQEILELLGGVLFNGEDAVNHTQKGAQYGVGVHVEDIRGGGGRGWQRLIARNP